MDHNNYDRYAAAQAKTAMLNQLLQQGISDDYYGGRAVAHICSNSHTNEANAQIERSAKWFILPHPRGRCPQGECDFVANRLVRCLYSGEQNLSTEALAAVHSFFFDNNFESKYKSENHMFLFRTSRYLISQKYSGQFFKVYNKNAVELLADDGEWLKSAIRYRAQRGWAEFHSVGYMGEVFACLLNLYDFANDRELRILSRQMLDFLLCTILDSSLEGLYGGAHGRIYEPAALDHKNSGMYSIIGLYFGFRYEYKLCKHIEPLLSDYLPSEFVYNHMRESQSGTENNLEIFESIHLHSITCSPPHIKLPEERGSLNRYTYKTPKYILGAVNLQDDYENEAAKWYAHHQQHEWDLTLTGGTDIRIFTHHSGSAGPEGEEHGYWTGDLGCCCGSFFAHENIVLCMYDIPENELQQIHAYVPQKHFNYLEVDKFLLLNRDDIFISLYFSNGFYFTDEGKYAGLEVKSDGCKHFVVTEVCEGFADLSSFRDYTLSQPIITNIDKMSLKYKGLYMNKTERWLNGKQVNFPYPTYHSQHIRSAFNSGIVDIRGEILKFC